MGLRKLISHLSNHRQKSILSASIVLGVTFALSAVLGFLRSRFLYARFFGCCVLELDAYNAAFRLPDLIFKLLVTGALSASFIPVFSSYLHRDEKTAHRIASTVINLLLIAFIGVSLLVLIFTPQLTTLIAGGFSPAQLKLMTELTRILLLAQIFFLVSNFLTGILQVNQVFLLPALSPIIYNIFIILSIFTLAPTFGIYGVTWGAVVGAFFHLAIQLPALHRTGFKYSLLIQPQLAGVKEVVRLMLPRSLSLGLGEVENTVTLFFASSLAAGSLSLFNLSLQIMYLPSRIFGTTIGQASLPILSKNIARNELETFRDTVRKTILQSLFIALPITTVILVHRVPIIRLAFGAKQFPWSATLLTARTLALLTPAIACQAVIQILVRSFYAYHDTKTPLYVSAVSLFFNVLSSFLLVNYTSLGILGLAISVSIGNLVQCLGLGYLFIRKIDGTGWSDVFWRIGKISFASMIMGFFTWFVTKYVDYFVLDTSRTISLITTFSSSTALGVICYLAIAKLIHIPELGDYSAYWHRLRRRFQSS